MSFNPQTGLVYLPAQNIPLTLMDDKSWKHNAHVPGAPPRATERKGPATVYTFAIGATAKASDFVIYPQGADDGVRLASTACDRE
jgi:hypothetical protein